MKKRINIDDLQDVTGPMNSVALDDAASYLGLTVDTELLSPHDRRAVMAKKKKIVNSTKKAARKISKELTKQSNYINGTNND